MPVPRDPLMNIVVSGDATMNGRSTCMVLTRAIQIREQAPDGPLLGTCAITDLQGTQETPDITVAFTRVPWCLAEVLRARDGSRSGGMWSADGPRPQRVRGTVGVRRVGCPGVWRRRCEPGTARGPGGMWSADGPRPQRVGGVAWVAKGRGDGEAASWIRIVVGRAASGACPGFT
jgi:hypothetical protein